jgi:preprotein translocase subunit SecG
MTIDNNFYTDIVNKITINFDNPWPGLLAYSEKDSNFFCGREHESDELYRLITRRPLTVFFGISGVGKTSLLQAGLFPRLRQENVLPIYIRLGFSNEDISLVNQVKKAIELQSIASGVEAPSTRENEPLWEYFHRKNADFWNKRNRLIIPMLVFDQFEEIFTLGRFDKSRITESKNFLDELGNLIEGRPPLSLKKKLDKNPADAEGFSFSRHYYKILVCLREDYIPELESLRDQIPSIIFNRFRLLSLNGKAAFQVVSQAKHLIKSNIAEKIVRFVAASNRSNLKLDSLKLEPALLSVVCYELNKKRQDCNEKYITGDLFQGSHEQILSGFYERSLNGFSQEVQSFIEEKLVTVSGHRDSIAIENALSISGINQNTIDRLINRRLIRIDERVGRRRIELTHDLLTGVIVSNRNQRRKLIEAKTKEKNIIEREQKKRLKERAKQAKIFRSLFITMTIFFIIAIFMSYTTVKQRKLIENQFAKVEDQSQALMIQKRALELQKEQLLGSLKELKEQTLIAEKAKSEANQRYQRMMDNIKLRQTILSRDYQKINDALKNFKIEDKIKWKAIAKEYPYKSKTGLNTYKFQIYPIKQSIPGGFFSIALITYIMDHPSFLNPLLTTGPDTKFTGTYDGVGCLDSVTAVIEYSDLDQPIAVAEIPMCSILEKINL